MLIKLTSDERRQIKRELLAWYRVESSIRNVHRGEVHRQFYSKLFQMGLGNFQLPGHRAKKPKYSELGFTGGSGYPTNEEIAVYRKITDGGDLGRDGFVTNVLMFDTDLITDRFEVASFNALSDLMSRYLGRANDFNHSFDVADARGRIIDLWLGADPGTDLHPDYPVHSMRQLASSNPFAAVYVALCARVAFPFSEGGLTVQKIQQGLFKDVSIAVRPDVLLCSECLKPMEADMCFTWCSEHGFPGGRTDEGRLVVGVIDKVTDVLTFGIVSDGAVKRAGIILDPGAAEEF